MGNIGSFVYDNTFKQHMDNTLNQCHSDDFLLYT